MIFDISGDVGDNAWEYWYDGVFGECVLYNHDVLLFGDGVLEVVEKDDEGVFVDDGDLEFIVANSGNEFFWEVEVMEALDAEEDFDDDEFLNDDRFLDDDEFFFGEGPKRSIISFSCLENLLSWNVFRFSLSGFMEILDLFVFLKIMWMSPNSWQS